MFKSRGKIEKHEEREGHSMMTTRRFDCLLEFSDAHRATPDEISGVLDKMAARLSREDVSKLSFSGNLDEGSLNITFELGTVSDAHSDSFYGISLVVKALNCARISAPGWPDDAVIDGAIASVTLREAILI